MLRRKRVNGQANEMVGSTYLMLASVRLIPLRTSPILRAKKFGATKGHWRLKTTYTRIRSGCVADARCD